MKRINPLPKLHHWFHTLFHRKLIYTKWLIPFGTLFCLAVFIWTMGPYFNWSGYAPLIEQEKRIDLILFLVLIWILKWTLFDWRNIQQSDQNLSATLKKKLTALESRFKGALQFLKQNTLTQNGHKLFLHDLPYYLLIGPENAGKTTLLLNADQHFILQKRKPTFESGAKNIQENCDWWVLRNACIIDVPGNYISCSYDERQDTLHYQALWNHFLYLLSNNQGKAGVKGIILALPLPKMMQITDTEPYLLFIEDLFQRLTTLQTHFQKPLPIQIVITQCDLLSGFTEFFAETGSDEMTQTWGFSLPQVKSKEKMIGLCIQQFNALIKKLNQQLIWRLHQERNSTARPYIKEFPLQVERLQLFTLDFIKKLLTTSLPIFIEGIYLTSAEQSNANQNAHQHVTILNQDERQLSSMVRPSRSHAYFIKNWVEQLGITSHPEVTFSLSSPSRKKQIAYTLSFSAILITTFIMGKDFKAAIKHTYATQQTLAQYHTTLAQFHNQDEALTQTLNLLNSLQQSYQNQKFNFNLTSLTSFYSKKSSENTKKAYHEALNSLFIPTLKNYLEDYLKDPVNKNIENVYAALKSYLMLADPKKADRQFINNTLFQILSPSLLKTHGDLLSQSISNTFTSTFKTIPLDDHAITQTRDFLNAMDKLKLSYIILKNINNNNMEDELDLETKGTHPIFTTHSVSNQIPIMFTAKTFPIIFSKETKIAAEETINGNWVLGQPAQNTTSQNMILDLTSQLRAIYVNHYIDVWESKLSNLHINTPKNFSELDRLLTTITHQHSPFIKLLNTLKEHTDFQPIMLSSPKLQQLNLLVQKNNIADSDLYQIFSGLVALHQYLQPVFKSENPEKAAFDALAVIMKNRSAPDVITQLRIIADKNPEPIKNWLLTIADSAWRLLANSASHYLNTAWQQQVIAVYKNEIENRYPFNAQSSQEISLQQFILFFGTPGVIVNFYNQYLQAFVDTAHESWQWKVADPSLPLPFSKEVLHQIQSALAINHAFFPNGDNKLYVEFALQPYQFSSTVKQIKLNIHNKQIIDDANNLKASHLMSWPHHHHLPLSTIEMTLADKKIIHREFSGDWGWFKVVNQSFESSVSKKQILLNLSNNEHQAKYMLFTHRQNNPFLLFNLNHFYLSEKLAGA